MKNHFIAATLIVATLLYGCGEQSSSASGPWTAEIQPDPGALSNSRSLGEFRSYDACVEAAMKALGGNGVFSCSII
jgi:hypothetical protein